MAKLINGDGNKAIYAAQDADLIASITGNASCVAAVGNEYGYTLEDASTIGLGDGVIITKEGRRIQLDAGQTDIFEIPTGTTGVTNYYIIGYHLYTEQDSSQVCETFVQKMADGTATITEDTFRGGASDVYVSVYRVKQVSMNIDTVTLLLPKLSNLTALNTALSGKADTGSSVDLSGNGSVILIRIGKLRILKLFNARHSTLQNITLPTNDRPSSTVQGVGIRHVLNDNTNYCFAFANVNANGTIQDYMATGFNDSTTYTTSDCSTLDVTWMVD